MQKEPVKPGEESVWDYPRPPKIEADQRELHIFFAKECVAHTHRALRCLETSHPPVFYIPIEDIKTEYLRKGQGQSYCEYKGSAEYWDLIVNDKISHQAAWSYPDPNSPYQALKGHLAFYASRADRCTVEGETVISQEGDFYGGWITHEIKGPFKGPPGTLGW